MSIDLGGNETLGWNPSLEIRRLFDRTLFHLSEGGANVRVCSSFTHQHLIEVELIRTINEARYLTTCLANDVDKYLSGVTENSPHHNSQDLLNTGLLNQIFADRLAISINLRHLCNDTLRDYQFSRMQYSQIYLEPLFSSCGDILISLVSDIFPYKSELRRALPPHLVSCFTGYPQMSLPIGFSEPRPGAPKGLPLGLHVMTKPGNEHLLVRFAYAFQKKFGPGPVLPASVPSLQESSALHVNLKLGLFLPFFVDLMFRLMGP